MKTFENGIDAKFEMYSTSNVSTFELMNFMDGRNTFAARVEVKVKMKPYDVFGYLKTFFGEEQVKFNFFIRSFYIRSASAIVTVDFDTFGGRENPSGQYTINFNSLDYVWLEEARTKIEDYFEPFEVNSIVWAIMAPNGDTIHKEMDISRKYNKAIDEFYPWLGKNQTLDEYYDAYLKSEENILLLVGDPGTGKTTFIKNLLIKRKLNAIITYDEKLMRDDGFFLDFITSNKDVLIIEDADTLIHDRERDDNTIMSKILNVSDGIIKNVDKKIIFSTNITDINRIDSALMRPGRCFDTINFRKLKRDEATNVLNVLKIDKQLDENKNAFTLAELLSNGNREQHFNKHKVGF